MRMATSASTADGTIDGILLANSAIMSFRIVSLSPLSAQGFAHPSKPYRGT